jgi:type II secretory pathway component PulF
MASLFSPRISLQNLAQLSRRLAIALASGIEVRRVVEREASNTLAPVLRAKLREIQTAVAKGDTVTEGLARTGDYFPPLLAEMVEVGEHTGHLAEVFRRLADHYEEQMRLRRLFLSSIAWPVIQLVLAIVVIGIMILVLGAISSMRPGQTTDILGLGLIGPSGFAIYCMFIATAAGGLFLVYQAARRGLAWTEPVQKIVLQLPGAGAPLRTISLAQMAWTMELTLDSGMDLLKAMALSLRSTHNAFYTQHTDQVLRALRSGREIHEVLGDTGAFPFEFLASVEVGERSGRLPEAMKSLSTEYHERARHAVQTLTVLAGWGVWVLVVIMIVGMIFRIAMQTFVPYVQTINELAK